MTFSEYLREELTKMEFSGSSLAEETERIYNALSSLSIRWNENVYDYPSSVRDALKGAISKLS